MFNAWLIDKHEGQQTATLQRLPESGLPGGDVTVRVAWSTLNFKDALAITGRSPVGRRFPMVPGIDFAGTVEASTDPTFAVGDPVVLNGWGVGQLLANICAAMCDRGVVTACGLTAGMAWPASVAPFILRGVTLAGIDSVMAPASERLQAWQRLAQDLDPALLEHLIHEIALGEVPDTAAKLLDGHVRGRIVVRVDQPMA